MSPFDGVRGISQSCCCARGVPRRFAGHDAVSALPVPGLEKQVAFENRPMPERFSDSAIQRAPISVT